MKTFNVLRSDGSIAIVDADYIKVREGVLSACKIVTLSSTSMGDTVVYLFNAGEWKEAWAVDT